MGPREEGQAKLDNIGAVGFRWNLGTTYRRRAFIVCEGSPTSPRSPEKGTLANKRRMEVRSAPGSAIMRAGGMTVLHAGQVHDVG
jgi:hypothetical protein